MGDPRKLKSKHASPRKPWDKKAIESERKIVKTYGLVSKREIRRVEMMVSKKRENARKMLALPFEQRKTKEKELLHSLAKMGLLKGATSVDDVLTLTNEEFFERRLQTIVWRKSLALTPKQARQFIVHGHIAVRGRKVTSPSYIVKETEENAIGYYGKPPVLLAPQKKKADLKKKFEEAAGEEALKEAGATEAVAEVAELPEAAAAPEETKTSEGKE